MCGIAGYISSAIGPSALDALLNAIRHRGPDGDGHFHDAPIHMGMRRLSVIDPNGGWQPLTARDGRIVAFQNGEIYNYRQLRAELEAAGFVFRTHSDTETIAHGYAAWGMDGLLARLDGMYAIALYDRDRRELHLARDRFGEKPLYFAASDQGFAYGSSLLTVAAMPWVGEALNLDAIDDYLACHFITAGRTPFADVDSLHPGERMVVAVDDLTITRARYYRPALTAPRAVGDDELAARVEQAVTSRLVSDVPIGVFLSGGLDSSVVAAIAAAAKPDIDTFSMGFSDAAVDETEHAAAVARHIGSRHHTFTFDQNSFAQLVPEVAAALDTPIGDQAMLPVYWLSREARRHVTVVLAGEGADEVFAGYGYYRGFVAADTAETWRTRLARLFGGRRPLPPPSRLLGDQPPVTASGFPLLTDRATRRALLGGRPDPAPTVWERDCLAWLGGADNRLQAATAAEIATWLADDLLVKFDRMAMAHSLEGRAPYLQPDLVELGLNLPPDRRMTATADKIALRRIAGRYLPPALVERRKQGFVLPMKRWVAEWFQAAGGPVAYCAARTLPGLDGDRLAALIAEDLTAGVHRERLLFAVIMLLEWWRYFSAKRAELRRAVAHPEPVA